MKDQIPRKGDIKDQKRTVKQLAKLSGVSVRTLHHYDQIGLLKPASYGDNGYRYYQKEQVLLLQQILFYRGLGFELGKIQEIIHSKDFDKVKALKSHREALLKSRVEIEGLIQTIEKTIINIKEGSDMKDDEYFYGFDSQKQKDYQAELVQKYGQGAQAGIDESRKRTKDWKKEDYDRVREAGDELCREFVKLMEQGLKPQDPRVQELAAQHYKGICLFWTPNAEQYRGLGQLYLDHPDFRKFYDRFRPDLVDFLAKAMTEYSGTRL